MSLIKTTFSVMILFIMVNITFSMTVEADELIISEYVHLPGNNGGDKAIEFYNHTDEALDLSDYVIRLYVNGANLGDSQNVKSERLSGILEPGETHVLIHTNASDELRILADQESNFPTFNGDDALVLLKNGEAIDRFGQVGVKEVWSGGSTGPEVWSRKPEITSGDADITAPFSIYDEWVYQGESHSLGVHEDNDRDPFTIADVRAIDEGEVIVEGVITARHNHTLHIQDEAAAIAIFRQSAIPDVSVGDRVVIRGERADYGGMKQVQNPELMEITSHETPEPKIITDRDEFHAYESKLVTVKDITLTNANAAGGDATNYTIHDKSLVIRDENSQLNLELNTLYSSITGTLTVYNNTWQLLPRDRDDVLDNVNQVLTPSANIVPSRVKQDSVLYLTTETIDATIYFTLDGTIPTPESQEYDGGIILDTLGEVTLTMRAFHDELEPSETVELTYDVRTSGTTMIHEIQGDGHISPYDGSYVSDVYGIVTYYYMNRGHHYFHIQTPDDMVDDDPNTSEGLLVFTESEHPFVEVGDEVLISGVVNEFYIDGFDDRERTDLPVTQLNAREYLNGNIDILTRGNDLPAPYLIEYENIPENIASPNHFSNDFNDYFDRDAYAIDFWESLEGMRVQVDDPIAVSPQKHGDIITTIDKTLINTDAGGVLLTEEGPETGLIHFRLHDNRAARNFPVKTGDSFEGPIIGHVSYAYQHYKLNVDLDEMEARLVEGDTEPAVTSIFPRADKLTIATYNLENFSASELQTSDDKAQKLSRAIVSDLKAPDIVGVTEVQDEDGPIDSGVSAAAASYERLIEAIEVYGGPRYEYVHIDPIDRRDGGQPGANIQVGFLYNPERVSFDSSLPHGGPLDAIDYVDGSVTLNPGRIDPENPILNATRKPLVAQFDFQGEQVLVIVNHWNSKLGDDGHYGQVQPPDTSSEDRRIGISLIVQAFIERVVMDNPDANIVSLGDFNAFQWEESMLIQEDHYMTNMVHHVPESERYSYIYNGSSQVLDHIFVSNHLETNTEIDMIKINADFTDMHGRASDHDPLLIQIDFSQ